MITRFKMFVCSVLVLKSHSCAKVLILAQNSILAQKFHSCAYVIIDLGRRSVVSEIWGR